MGSWGRIWGGEEKGERKPNKKEEKSKGFVKSPRGTQAGKYGKRETASLVGNGAKRSMAKPRLCGGATDYF